MKLDNPTILVLLETKMAKHKGIISELGFDDRIQSPAIGRYGGMVIMWKDNFLRLKEISITYQFIDTKVKVIYFSHS